MACDVGRLLLDISQVKLAAYPRRNSYLAFSRPIKPAPLAEESDGNMSRLGKLELGAARTMAA